MHQALPRMDDGAVGCLGEACGAPQGEGSGDRRAQVPLSVEAEAPAAIREDIHGELLPMQERARHVEDGRDAPVRHFSGRSASGLGENCIGSIHQEGDSLCCHKVRLLEIVVLGIYRHLDCDIRVLTLPHDPAVGEGDVAGHCLSETACYFCVAPCNHDDVKRLANAVLSKFVRPRDVLAGATSHHQQHLRAGRSQLRPAHRNLHRVERLEEL
mmetsp:Transcript_52949/g.134334  ORF Transcript_52949/g.134334 Transcript_52949/m.134334 type:complete len:213 (-) Transcript_52949:101-739(-)